MWGQNEVIADTGAFGKLDYTPIPQKMLLKVASQGKRGFKEEARIRTETGVAGYVLEEGRECWKEIENPLNLDT